MTEAGLVQHFFPAAPRPRIARAEGIWFITEDGQRLMDASSGPVVSNLGHGNARVLAALERQARSAAFAFPMQFESAANAELGALLSHLAGPGFERAFLCSGGSEAVETAIKFARQHAVVTGHRQRWKVIARDPGYHGNTLGALAISGDHLAHEIFGPLLTPQPKVPAPFTYRVPENHTAESWARHCAQEIERTILTEGADTVLAFIMEPVGGLATGALVAPDLYHTLVREICDRHGVLLIHDEVMSGAGRTGRFLAAEHWPQARPDIVVLAKGITAGYTPMGAVLVPARMADAIAAAGGFMHGFTYFANPLSCAVGAAVLHEVIDRDLIGNAARMGETLRKGLLAIRQRCPILGDVRGLGLLQAIEFVADQGTKRMIPLDRMAPYRFQQIALEHGLAIYCRRTAGGRWGDWVMISPPLTITEDELGELLARLERALSAFAAELAAGC